MLCESEFASADKPSVVRCSRMAFLLLPDAAQHTPGRSCRVLTIRRAALSGAERSASDTPSAATTARRAGARAMSFPGDFEELWRSSSTCTESQLRLRPLS
eukprot:4737487-Pleurochrysis_carterae.AAC.9